MIRSIVFGALFVNMAFCGIRAFAEAETVQQYPAVSQEELDKAKEEMKDTLRDMRVESAVKDGEPAGLKLTKPSSQSGFRNLAIQSGEVQTEPANADPDKAEAYSGEEKPRR